MIVNLTPHIINVLVDDQQVIVEKRGKPPRVEESLKYAGQHDGVHIYEVTYGPCTSLPPIEQNTLYIVSRMIVDAMPGRNDLVFPLMLERDTSGNITVARALGRIAK